MGLDTSKPTRTIVYDNRFTVERLGCDFRGTKPCPPAEDNIICLNGGVCAFFVREYDDECERRCRCTAEYMGKHCEQYNGFLTATMTLMVGCLLAFIFLIFLLVILWYCCSQRAKRRRLSLDKTESHPPRVQLPNRMNEKMQFVNSFQSSQSPPMMNQCGQQDTTVYKFPDDPNSRFPNAQESYISPSYSPYDGSNVAVRKDNPSMLGSQNGTVDETSHLLPGGNHVNGTDHDLGLIQIPVLHSPTKTSPHGSNSPM